jgi:hypothetical protein
LFLGEQVEAPEETRIARVLALLFSGLRW